MSSISLISESMDSLYDSSPVYTNVLSESMHQKIHDILDSDHSVSNKLNFVTKTVRGLIKSGIDTGLESDKPKKGSSRAVFFPKEHRDVIIDGKPAKVPSVVKIAFPSSLDKYREHDEDLLGEMQNRKESDFFVNRVYSVLKPGQGRNEFETNHEGILPPHFGHHEDYHHLEMGRVSKLNSKDFKEATMTEEHPKGITHTEMFDAVNHNFARNNGRHYSGSTPQSRIDEIQEHPLVANVSDLSGNTEMHPADLAKRNMGIWHHPITGKKHVVISDFGGSKDILDQYAKLRQISAGYRQRQY